MRLEIKNLYIERAGKTLPALPYEKIKNEILGKDYNLNIIYCSPAMSQKLNSEYRKKDYPTNILSFPLDHKQGEIYIQLRKARSDAKLHNMSYNKFIHLLLIHGCLHLANHDHGDEMEYLEDRYMQIYFKSIEKNKSAKSLDSKKELNTINIKNEVNKLRKSIRH